MTEDHFSTSYTIVVTCGVECLSPHCNTYSQAEFEVRLSYHGQLAAEPEN